MAENTDEVMLFISHHSSTLETALEVETALAARGVSCWIAPRDVEPGEPFDNAVRAAIERSAAVLLLFCEKSDQSKHVKRELILGDSAGRPIIPLRLESIHPRELAYHLADSQWIDWIDRREAVMDRVAVQARHYAGIPSADAAPALSEERRSGGGLAGVSHRKLAIAGGIISFLIALIAITWIIATRGADDSAQQTASADEAEQTTLTPSVEEAPTATEEPDVAEASLDGTQSAPLPQAESVPSQSAPRPVSPARTTRETVPSPPATRTPTPAPPANQPVVRTVQRCAGVPTDTDYLICADPGSQQRASEMSGLIRAIRQSYQEAGDNPGAFNTEQRNWFNTVRATCHSIACIAPRQTERLRALRAILAERS